MSQCLLCLVVFEKNSNFFVNCFSKQKSQAEKHETNAVKMCFLITRIRRRLEIVVDRKTLDIPGFIINESVENVVQALLDQTELCTFFFLFALLI